MMLLVFQRSFEEFIVKYLVQNFGFYIIIKKQKFVYILFERLRLGLQDVERKYLELCELGDENFVKNVLNLGRVFVDIEDIQGRIGFDILIESGYVFLVDYFLFKVSLKVIYQGFLCVIEYDWEEICEIFLNYLIY